MTTIDANPYAWPWDGDLAPAHLAVVVAGAQKYWSGCTLGVDTTLGVVRSVIDPLRDLGALIVWTRHGRTEASRNSLPVAGSEGWQLVTEPAPNDLVVDAGGHDGCYGGPLESLLHTAGRSRLVMCGLGLEGPVHSTLRALNDRGFECLTVTDACSPYDELTAAAAISSITMSFGIFGAVAPSTNVLAAFSQEAVLS